MLMFRCQLAKSLLDKIKLIELIFSWEERVSIDELSHDAAGSPYIDLLSIWCSYQQFRRTIPACSHVVSEGLVFIGLAGKAEITDLKLLLVTDQQVLRFDVPMQQMTGV